ncbi:pyridoxamine 5'-phosphate oxidase family protein [Haladaptatus sp. AB618]|uniref:pyridoxamine 5'-phosphate oxidase family protein n=1 Tax=Haladaptatus sp. AB618 TaxID=2934173 RepID=UPI00209C569D|nr:pyridoxamine 5'-phosphate oxidase family protein [Haladaptatus sp. AB618]MCO8256169.1 pyridoxamine 5'-phosphate oxidase family protein [Haladaptatus sp. AB618]
MTELSGVWSKDELIEYFERTTVPLRLACRTPSGNLWMVSLWYLYDGDALCCATAASADIVDLLRKGPSVAFEVSTNDPPYTGVRGNGTASVEPDSEKELLRELVTRYLGDADSRLARELLSDDRSEVTIRIEPNRLHSWDFTARMGEPSP